MRVVGCRTVGATIVVALGVGVAAVPAAHGARSSTGPSAKSPAAARALREEQRILRFINHATGKVSKHGQTCLVFPPDGPTEQLPGAPPAEVLNSVEALRRPQTAEDQVPGRSLGLGLVDAVYPAYTRTLTARDGRQFIVVPAREGSKLQVDEACFDATHRELVRALRDESRRFRQRTLRRFARIRDAQEKTAAHQKGPYERLLLFSRAPNGSLGGGGGGSFSYFLTHGNSGSSGSGSSSRIAGLVPDGVATVQMTFPKRITRGRYLEPKVYPRRIDLTLPIQQNVYSATVARSAPDAFASRTVWRAADGHVIRVIRP
jgi:hypothetical protein